jgi:hypothetical protein
MQLTLGKVPSGANIFTSHNQSFTLGISDKTSISKSPSNPKPNN